MYIEYNTSSSKSMKYFLFRHDISSKTKNQDDDLDEDIELDQKYCSSYEVFSKYFSKVDQNEDFKIVSYLHLL